jgi:SAM-dependent methyltransferase
VQPSLLPVLPLLRCQRCGARLTEMADGSLTCAIDGRSAAIRDGRVLWVDPPDDLVPAPLEAMRDPSRWTSWRRSNFAFYREQLAKTPHATLLDFGTGRAQFFDLFTGAETFVAADFIPYPCVNVVCDLTARLPLADDAFDAIVASNVFEHLPNTAEVLLECHRVLKPGASLLATIPFLIGVHQEPYDFHRYTPFMLKRLLHDAGFVDIGIQPLAKPADLYRDTEGRFFGMLFNHIKDISAPWERAVYWFRLKSVWKIHQLLHILEKGLLTRVGPHEAFTLGFGFTAKKPSVGRAGAAVSEQGS